MNKTKIWAAGLAFVFALAALAPSMPAQAQTTADANLIATLQEQINNLLKQIADLQAKIVASKNQTSAIKSEINATKKEFKEFRKHLREGLSDEEVRLLQEALASDSALYPEGLVTGYYGPLTTQAIKRFQERHGIEALGIVGPKTLLKLNQVFAGKANNAADSLATTTPSGVYAVTICHKADSNNRQTISISSAALSAHLNHGDTVGACSSQGTDDDDDEDEDENNDDDSADVTVPVISDLHASATSSTTTHIIWTTNENADGSVWYGTTTPASPLNALGSMSNNSLANNHDFLLDNLTASTTYYYFVNSKDAAGNSATSTEQSFIIP